MEERKLNIMSKRIRKDLTGLQFNKWTVIKFDKSMKDILNEK
jgi:hypothetical protein